MQTTTKPKGLSKIWREIKRPFKNLLFGSCQERNFDQDFRNILAELNENSVCIDCGANVGTVTTRFAERGAEVHAFEPNPVAFAELKKNCSTYPKVTLYQQGVLDKNDTLNFYMHECYEEDNVLWSQGSSLYRQKVNVNERNFIEIEVIDLIAFIENFGKPIDVLKLDIEGCEYDILLPLLEKDLHKNIKHILVEIHDDRVPDIIPKGNRVRELIKEKSADIKLDWI